MLTPLNYPFTPLSGGSVDWADYDNDGDVDLVLTGHDGTNRRIIFHRNDPGGILIDVGNLGLPGITLSEVAFGDFDADGDLDIAMTGDTAPGLKTSRIYANNGTGTFTLYSMAPTDVYRSSVAWGDYDNDGDLDLGIIGYTGTAIITEIYENTGTGFVAMHYPRALYEGSVTWADVDEDGTLDFFETGYYNWTTPYASLYRNLGGCPNNAPTAPTTLTCVSGGGAITLSWSGATDVETPTAGLYYALRVGTSPGANDVASGTYATPLMGNRGQMTSLALKVPPGTYYWAVRSVDSGFMPRTFPRTSIRIAWSARPTCWPC
jgi:hypothetical protein